MSNEKCRCHLHWCESTMIPQTSMDFHQIYINVTESRMYPTFHEASVSCWFSTEISLPVSCCQILLSSSHCGVVGVAERGPIYATQAN